MRRVTSKTGFSTLEMIVTTLLLALSMTVLTSGASAVSAIYRRTLAKADAQMIYSQIETNLRAELAFADSVTVNAEKKVQTYEVNFHLCNLTLGKDGSGGPLYVRYYDARDPNTKQVQYNADGSIAYNMDKPYYYAISPTQQKRLEDLKVKNLPEIKYENGCFKVSGLQVEYDGQNMIANTDTPQFIIRAANDVNEKSIASP